VEDLKHFHSANTAPQATVANRQSSQHSSQKISGTKNRNPAITQGYVLPYEDFRSLNIITPYIYPT
jgi:hypothetical protein